MPHHRNNRSPPLSTCRRKRAAVLALLATALTVTILLVLGFLVVACCVLRAACKVFTQHAVVLDWLNPITGACSPLGMRALLIATVWSLTLYQTSPVLARWAACRDTTRPAGRFRYSCVHGRGEAAGGGQWGAAAHGKALASAVTAMTPSEAVKLCGCGCGRVVTELATYAGSGCRMRMMRRRHLARQG